MSFEKPQHSVLLLKTHDPLHLYFKFIVATARFDISGWYIATKIVEACHSALATSKVGSLLPPLTT